MCARPGPLKVVSAQPSGHIDHFADETAAAVKAIVAELGASGPGDMGKVMGAAKTRLAGKADRGAVSGAVKQALSK